ncbi:MAG: hypothetical protein CME13_11875 [Gemmatimonadetes bacterium]|nr:hypothetical protein [Gemmatimonadota bacterium]
MDVLAAETQSTDSAWIAGHDDDPVADSNLSRLRHIDDLSCRFVSQRRRWITSEKSLVLRTHRRCVHLHHDPILSRHRIGDVREAGLPLAFDDGFLHHTLLFGPQRTTWSPLRERRRHFPR